MKVTKELKTLISNRVWDRITKENEETRKSQAELIQKLNEEVLQSKEYKAREEAENAFSDMVAKIAEENGVSTHYGRPVGYRNQYAEKFFYEKYTDKKSADSEIARIITRIEYGTDYSDLTSVLAEYGIEL